ncbi:linker histone H1 and H5 family-domain-containing protein [Blyttiomyces helicus]|uniref:Histone H1 n=1 Tax=Blyttiomyces helicus TaxID=388810 RepID=A0A4P9WPT0_9FUNG|nr:linker histone H1 and H5 family-domain-containing protein [Blyttiomyces helicus]|eukprot:RKO94143.1 linker histone H1 and H5 family-domain-containing protein [Blyttiomyces helicus]
MPAATATHPTYKDMIVKAIASLAEKNGSSRHAIKKYIFANYKVTPGAAADSHLAMALKRGVDASHFVMPKGASGTVKLAPELKKAAQSAEKKAAAPPKVKKAAVTKPAAAKKATANKVTKVTAKKAVVKKVGKAKPAAVKKAASPKKAVAAKKSSPKKAKAAAPEAAAPPKAKRGPPKERA